MHFSRPCRNLDLLIENVIADNLVIVRISIRWWHNATQCDSSFQAKWNRKIRVESQVSATIILCDNVNGRDCLVKCFWWLYCEPLSFATGDLRDCVWVVNITTTRHCTNYKCVLCFIPTIIAATRKWTSSRSTPSHKPIPLIKIIQPLSLLTN